MRWLILALCGAAICTVCDHLHATHGVLWYTHPVVWDQGGWGPPLLSGASLAGPAGCRGSICTSRWLPGRSNVSCEGPMSELTRRQFCVVTGAGVVVGACGSSPQMSPADMAAPHDLSVVPPDLTDPTCPINN